MTNYTIIGIDFGTSTTVVKVKNYYDGMKNNECQSLVVNNSTVIPTLVFERSVDHQLFFGADADTEFNNNTEGTLYRNFKMDLLQKDPEALEKAKFLVKEFMKYLYRQFSIQKAQLNVCEIIKTYISYPAKWTPEIISFMKQSVIDAGFGTTDNVFGETEPTAAIYATFTNHADALKQHRLVTQDVPINVMMLDMGAGTSDVTIFRFLADRQNQFHIGVDGKIISHPAVDNRYLCGGREVDKMLCEYNMDYMRSIVPEAMLGGFSSTNESGTKTWKERNVSPCLLQDTPATTPGHVMSFIKNAKFFYPQLSTAAPFPEIDRKAFEDLTKEHWRQLHTLVTDAISKAAVVIPEIKGPEDIDLLIVTGGHSQWYCVRELCLGRSIAGLPPIGFKKIIADPERLLSEARPQETVANGLIFTDLPFEINHSSSNNLWLQIILDENNQSPVYQPVDMFDSLPAQKKIVWNKVIKAGSFCMESVKLRCVCCYGATIDDGVVSSHEADVPLNNLFTVLGKMLFLPLFLRSDEEYKISVTLDVRIDEDGSGHIIGTFDVLGGGNRVFSIKL